MKKLNLDENTEPTGGEKFLLDFTASTSFDQIKYLSWTTAEVIDVMDEYHDKNVEERDLTNLDAKELFKVLVDNSRKFVKVSFFAYFEDGLVKELNSHVVEYGMLGEEQVKTDIENTEDWVDHWGGKDGMPNGYYGVDAIFKVETDGDDYRDWSWGELEHAELFWAYSKEEEEEENKKSQEAWGDKHDDNLDDLFSF